VNLKEHGLQIDNHMNWKNHTEQMIPKLSVACCAVRSMGHISNINILKSIYCACCNSVIKYGIFCGGNFSIGGKIFTLQKKIIRIMAGAQPRTSCGSLFKQLVILPVPCQYIFSLILTSLSVIRKILKNHLYTILIEGISIIIITDQMPTYLVFKKVHLCWHKNFQQFTT
jgi:hypothetical protein